MAIIQIVIEEKKMQTFYPQRAFQNISKYCTYREKR